MPVGLHWSRHDWFLLADMPPTLDDAFRQAGGSAVSICVIGIQR